jgi:hypothetical protein
VTYDPQTLKDLMAFWVAQGGVNLGITGDAAHAARASYHNGWDRAISRYGTTDMAVVASRDYTFFQARDRVKSAAASAVDFGRLDGSLPKLYAFSTWLVEQCIAGAPGTSDIREVIWSPDGVYVKRWDHVSKKVYISLRKNADGTITVINPRQGDAGHFTHTHGSFYRDSELRGKVAIIARYFEVLDPMISLPAPANAEYGGTVTLKPGFRLYNAPEAVLSRQLIHDNDLSGQTLRAIGSYPGWRMVEYTFKPDYDGDPLLRGTTKGVYVPAGQVASSADNLLVPIKPPAPVEDPKPLIDAAFDEALDAAEAAVHAVPRRTNP